MRKSRLLQLGLALAGLLHSGCASSRLIRLDDVPPENAIAVGRFHVKLNGKDVTKNSNIVFDCTQFLTAKGQFFLDESGYLFGTMPAGNHSIRFIVAPGGLSIHNLEAGELTCTLKRGAVNYIGDVTLDWQLAKNYYKSTSTISVEIQSNLAADQTAFQRKYSTNRELSPSLLTIHPAKK